MVLYNRDVMEDLRKTNREMSTANKKGALKIVGIGKSGPS